MAEPTREANEQLTVQPVATMTGTTRVSDNATDIITVTPFQTPTPFATLTTLPTLTAMDTAVPEATIEPVVTAARLFPHSWSPDSQWLAYWTFTEEEVALDFTLPPGLLYFFNASSGESCQSLIDVPYGYFDSALAWLPDGRVQVRGEQGVIEGTPCQDNFTLVKQSYFIPVNTSLSPSSNYRAYTIQPEPASFVTTLADTATGETLRTVEWQSLLATLGEQGIGGQWVNNHLFLIWESDQGPLIMTVAGEVISVASHLFNQSIEIVCERGELCETTLAATGATVFGTDVYHLILYGMGVVTDYPPIRLYHSESGLVEELDFQHHGGFAPDGQTLLLFTDDVTEEPRYHLWLRTVDPPSSKPYFLLTSSINPLPIVWSPDSTKFMVNSLEKITIFSISGSIINVWQAAGWKAMMPASWSPDGHHVAVQGFSSSAGPKEALFVVSIPAMITNR